MSRCGLKKLSRRTVLRGAGVAIALPWLDAFARGAGSAGPPRRALFIMNNLGVLPKPFFPGGDRPGLCPLAAPRAALQPARRLHRHQWPFPSGGPGRAFDGELFSHCRARTDPERIS